MTLVADASPLIFLGKVRRLALIDRVLGGDVVVPQQVRDAESDELHRFLAAVRMERVDSPRVFAAGMSRADNAAMTLAVRLKRTCCSLTAPPGRHPDSPRRRSGLRGRVGRRSNSPAA